MLGIRTRLHQMHLDVVGHKDLLRLKRSHRLLVPSESEWEGLRRDLLPAYEDYVANVSTPGMAASLETSLYLYCLCRALAARSVLDLGSGFSSYVLRRYAHEAPHEVAVTSVDDDPAWLSRTEDFLRRHGCATGGLMEWTAYRAGPTGPHGVVFHDLAGGEVRDAAMRFAVGQVSRNGVIVFDDAHDDGLRQRMYAEGSKGALELYSLRGRTADSIGRWAVLGVAAAP